MNLSEIKVEKFYYNKNSHETTTEKEIAYKWAKEAHVGIIIWSSVCNEYHEIAEMYF